MEREEGGRKFSFSYDVGIEKLRLIDVSKEDDFLIASPLFDSLDDLRLSVSFDNTNENEATRWLEGEKTEEFIFQKEHNLSHFVSMEPSRPSYLRRSLAWDSAFFDSAGVLDPDELTFMNKGLKAVEDIRKRGAEAKSIANGSRKIDIGHQNKNTTPSSQRRRIQRSERTKTAHDSRRDEASIKPRKASEPMETLLRGQSTCEIEEKTSSRSDCTRSSGSSRKIPSGLVKGKTEPRKSKLYASTSMSETTPRLSKKSKELGTPNLSTVSRSFSNNMACISPASSSKMSLSKSTSRSKHQPKESADTPHTSQRKSSLSLQCDEIKSPDQTNVEFSIGTCTTSTEPRKKFKPSGLRQPSPKIGFFDEKKAIWSKDDEDLQFRYEIESTSLNDYEYGSINRKRPAKLHLQDELSPKTKTLKHSGGSHLLNSARGIKGRTAATSDKKLWNSSPRVSGTMKSWSAVAPRHHHTRKCVGTEEEICSKSKVVDSRESVRKRFGLKGRLKKKSGIENKAQKDDVNIDRAVKDQSAIEKKARTADWEEQVSDLSKCFGIIELSNDVPDEVEGNENRACSQNGNNNIEDHMDIKSPLFSRKNILDDENRDLSETGILPSSRTPLADKTSVFNMKGSSKSPVESTKGKLMAKALANISSFEGIDKENI